MLEPVPQPLGSMSASKSWLVIGTGTRWEQVGTGVWEFSFHPESETECALANGVTGLQPGCWPLDWPIRGVHSCCHRLAPRADALVGREPRKRSTILDNLVMTLLHLVQLSLACAFRQSYCGSPFAPGLGSRTQERAI